MLTEFNPYVRFLMPVLWLLLTVPAFASGGGEEQPNLFTGDLGNILWSLLTFGVVLIFLGKFAWGPILGNLKKREDFIRESLEQAKKDREAAEATLKEYVKKVESARSEASAIVEEGRRDAEVLRREIEETGRSEAAHAMERAKREIAIATDTAVKEIYDLSGKLAVDVASRVIGKQLDAREHERLISESISEFQKIGRG